LVAPLEPGGYQRSGSGIPHLRKKRARYGPPGSWQGNRRSVWYIAEINVYLCDAPKIKRQNLDVRRKRGICNAENVSHLPLLDERRCQAIPEPGQRGSSVLTHAAKSIFRSARRMRWIHLRLRRGRGKFLAWIRQLRYLFSGSSIPTAGKLTAPTMKALYGSSHGLNPRGRPIPWALWMPERSRSGQKSARSGHHAPDGEGLHCWFSYPGQKYREWFA